MTAPLPELCPEVPGAPRTETALYFVDGVPFEAPIDIGALQERCSALEVALDEANNDRQALVLELDQAKDRGIELRDEVAALRRELEQARIQIGLERVCIAVTGRPHAEIAAELAIAEEDDPFRNPYDDETVVIDPEEVARYERSLVETQRLDMTRRRMSR